MLGWHNDTVELNIGTVGKRQVVAEEAGSLPHAAYELNDASQVSPAHAAK